MTSVLSLDALLFGVLPYVALAVFLLGSIARYRGWRYSYSSLSSQFLENRQHFWGLVPFHYGILVVLTGHLVAFLIPRSVLAWNAQPLRLYVLEVSALAFGVLTVIGLAAAVWRRITVGRVRRVTNTRDWVLFAMLGVQTVTGVLVAMLYPWGSSWFAATAAPYLWSLVFLRPDLTAMAAMPWLVKTHIVTAFVLVGYTPFSRLVHVLVAPLPYLWRKPQVVRWYRGPGVVS
ncbi:MAG: respiratory nitrate reductase subunit gamma [Vicinamibacteraceae bacterium]|nr:respiratory nitrate reductase subunit gamma [Vicinamibacteraceae bacterium]